MKLFILATLILSFNTTHAAAKNPYCEDFKNIKRLGVQLDKNRVDRILPYADWMDEKYRRQDVKQTQIIAGKTVFLLLIKRLTPFAYLFEPTRLGDGTITGRYARSPEGFAAFLELDSATACTYLSMGGEGAEVLRDTTHQMWVMLDRARR